MSILYDSNLIVFVNTGLNVRIEVLESFSDQCDLFNLFKESKWSVWQFAVLVIFACTLITGNVTFRSMSPIEQFTLIK